MVNAKLSRLLEAPALVPYTSHFLSNKSCDASEGGLIASDGPVSVDGNGEYPTPNGASPTQAATYYWVATYSGDANNKEASNRNTDQPELNDATHTKVETSQEPTSRH